MNTCEVTVVRAPGFADHFRARVIPGLHDIEAKDERGTLAVITFGDEEVAVVPARCLVWGSVDLVKRFEIDFDWEAGRWGVRHAYDGPFIRHIFDEREARGWIAWKVSP